MRRLLTYALWFVVIVAAIAIIIFIWRRLTVDNQDTVGGTVQLECNDACADYGQCGTLVDEPAVTVVLGGLESPKVDAGSQDVFFPNMVTVEIRETREETLEQLSTGRQFQVKFSRIEQRNNFGDVVGTGWVPDWCVRYP